ncbi:uncharacterized protein METZ01_LOCUS184408, partial [marine metagenome]
PHLVTLQTTIDEDVSEFDNLVHEIGIPAIVGRPEYNSMTGVRI